MVFSGNLSSFLKGVKPLLLYDEDLGMLLAPIQGILVSSQFDLWYTELFCIPEVTSGFVSYCVNVVGVFSRIQSSKSRLLTCLIGKTQLPACSAAESGLISRQGGSLMGLLELRQEPGVYSRVAVGMSIRNWSLFSEVRTPV